MASFDMDMRKLIYDLGKAEKGVLAKTESVVKDMAELTQKQMRLDVTLNKSKRKSYIKNFEKSITNEKIDTPGRIKYVIGPDKNRRQGALGNILYYGTSKTKPVLHIKYAMKTVEPKFNKAMEKMLDDIANEIEG